MSPSERHPKRAIASSRERKHVPGLVLPFLTRELLYLLKPAEWMVWTLMFLHSNREGYCRLLNETICELSGMALSTVQRAKSGLIQKGWIVHCGQKNRGSNQYSVVLLLPDSIQAFIAALWDELTAEAWWKSLGNDSHDYTDAHLDWLLAWRVIRAIRETENGKDWRPHEAIPGCVQREAMVALLSRLRTASALLTPEHGVWWLFGDGLDVQGYSKRVTQGDLK